MDISVESFKSVDLVSVTGRVDSTTAPSFSEALQQITDSGRYKIVVDLSGVDYMSSAGLRALVGTLRSCKGRFGDCKIAAPSGRVREVLDLAGLSELFDTHDNTTAAVGAF